MNFSIILLSVAALAAWLYFYRHPTGRVLRVAMTGTLRQLYLFLHPGRKSLPQSIAEARRQQAR